MGGGGAYRGATFSFQRNETVLCHDLTLDILLIKRVIRTLCAISTISYLERSERNSGQKVQRKG